VKGAEIDYYFGTRYEQYIRPLLMPQLTNLYKQYPGYLFIFTGHSLGGALTTLACHDAVLSFIIPSTQVWLYTYGSPRVGNPAFAFNVD